MVNASQPSRSRNVRAALTIASRLSLGDLGLSDGARDVICFLRLGQQKL
jgi:hypothetical protein